MSNTKRYVICIWNDLEPMIVDTNSPYTRWFLHDKPGVVSTVSQTNEDWLAAHKKLGNPVLIEVDSIDELKQTHPELYI